MPGSAEELVELLDLEKLDENLFRGRQPDTDRQRVFGGQVAAQTLLAAGATVEDRFFLHSLHSSFLHHGETDVPIIYDVERLRDSRSFATRRVSARQHGRQIFTMLTSHQVPEDGLFHADAMPSVIAPDQAVSLAGILAKRPSGGDGEWDKEWAALDVRYVGNSRVGLPEDPQHPARAQIWIRIDGELGEDTLLQQAAFAYASDLTLLGSALVPHDLTITSPGLFPASLDHSIWFHQPFRADQWWLYDQISPSASMGRGLVSANVFAESGALLATVAQQGLIRYTPGL